MINDFFVYEENVVNYLNSIFYKEDEILKNLRQLSEKEVKFSHMQVSVLEGQFLTFLTKLTKAEKILEIGSFLGYSSLCFAKADKKVKVSSIEYTKTWAEFAYEYINKTKYNKQIEIFIEKAEIILEKFYKEKNVFDLIFIDADKINYDKYYEYSLKLLKKGALIIIDNILFNGKVADEKNDLPACIALRNLNEKIKNDDRVNYSFVPLADGLLIIQKL